MKLSNYIKGEMDHIRGEFLLEAVDTDKDHKTITFYENGTSLFEIIKKVASAVACVVAVTAVVIAFILMRNSISGPGEIPADSGTETEDTENDRFTIFEYGEITAEESKARKTYEFRRSGAYRLFAYNNYYFYHTNGTGDGGSNGKSENILFYDVTYMTDEPMSAFFESVGNLPFDVDRMFIQNIIVDEYATEKKGGLPVFILFINAYRGADDLSGFYSYDMNSRKLRLCYRTNNADWMGLYGDRIYYSYDNGDKGKLLCSVRLDGTDKKEIDEELKFDPYILDVNDEYVFFSSGAGGTIYRCDTNFENVTEYAKTIGSVGHIHNGYFYYADDELTEEDYNGEQVTSRALVRKPVDAGLDDPEETVYEKSSMEVFHNGIVYIQERELGRPRHLANTIVKVDLDTLESEVVFEYTQNDDDLIELQCVYGDSWTLKVMKYEDGKYVKSFNAYYNLESEIWKEFEPEY